MARSGQRPSVLAWMAIRGQVTAQLAARHAEVRRLREALAVRGQVTAQPAARLTVTVLAACAAPHERAQDDDLLVGEQPRIRGQAFGCGDRHAHALRRE